MTSSGAGARVTANELGERLSEFTVLDVRTPAEFESVHIPGSFNLPLDRLPEYLGDLGSTVGGPVALVCRSGQRAQEAERGLMQASDMADVCVLEGGLSSWESAGLPVVRGQQRWSMERQVRGVAGSIVLASAAASFVAPPMAIVAAGVGAGLLFSALTDTCTMAKFLGKLPYNQGPCCDVSEVMREISARQQPAAATN